MKFLLWGPACFQEWTVSFPGGPKWSRLCFNDVHGKMWRLWPYQESEQEAIGNWNSRYLGVSENSGTPKSSILIGCSFINHPIWGTPIFGNTHLALKMWCCSSELQSSKKQKSKLEICLWPFCWGKVTLFWSRDTGFRNQWGGLFWHQILYVPIFFLGGGGRVSIFSQRVLHTLGALFWLDIIVKLTGCQLQVKKSLPTVLGKGTGSDSPNDSFGSPSFWMIKL